MIFEHSPYRFNTDGAPNHNVDFDVLPQEFIQPKAAAQTDVRTEGAKPIPDLPGNLDNFWVPRGYAVVLGESIGTAFSDGCPTIGDMKETLATKAVTRLFAGHLYGHLEVAERASFLAEAHRVADELVILDSGRPPLGSAEWPG